MVKRLLLAVLLLQSLMAVGQTERENIEFQFGDTYEKTLQHLVAQIGQPESEDSLCITYHQPIFQGIKFNKVEFGFQKAVMGLRLNQARFLIACPNKAAAIVKMRHLANTLEQRYTVSYDEEEGALPFYMGGRAPMGVGPLFTIYIVPAHGQWMCNLRYGPFKII